MGIASKILFGAAATSNGGTTAFTHSFGLTPKAGIFVLSGVTAYDTPTANARFAMGLFDGTRSRSFGTTAKDAVSDTTADRCNFARSDAHALIVPNVGLTTSFNCTAAWDDTTCTLTWGTAPGVAFKVMAVLLAGTDLTAYVGDLACPTTINTSASTTAPNFQFDQLLGWACTDTDFLGFDEAVHPHVRFNLCMADYNGATIKQRSLGFANEVNGFGAGTQIGQYFSTNYSVRNLIGWDGTTLLNAAEMTAVSSTGFTLTSRRTETGAPQTLAYLALKYSGGEHDLKDFTYKTSAGSQTHTGFGWEPAFVCALQGWVPDFDSWKGDADAGSVAIGFANVAEQGSAGISCLDGVNNPTDENSRMDNGRLISVGDQTMATPVKGTMTSLDADGLTINFTAVNGARRFSVLAFKEPVDENQEISLGAGATMTMTPGGGWAVDTEAPNLISTGGGASMLMSCGGGVVIGQPPTDWGNSLLGFRFTQPLDTSSTYLAGGPHDMVLRVAFNAARSAEIYNVISVHADRTPAETINCLDLFKADGTTHLNWHLAHVSPTSVVVEFRHPDWTLMSYGFVAYYGFDIPGVSFEDRAQCYSGHYGVYKFEEAG